MYVHTRERDSRPGFDGVKIKLLLLLLYAYILHYMASSGEISNPIHTLLCLTGTLQYHDKGYEHVVVAWNKSRSHSCAMTPGPGLPLQSFQII